MSTTREQCQGGMEFAHWVHRRGEKTYQFVVDNADDPMQICDYFARLAQEFAQDKRESKPDPIDMLAVWEYYCDHFDEGDKLPCEGALAKRQYVVDTMTAFCDHWWTYVHSFFGYDDSYDWEFLPVFLGRLSTHDVSKITPVEIEAALAAVIASDSFRLHKLKWKQGL